MLSNLVRMLKWCNNASRQNGSIWREGYHGQSVIKPFLSRSKFEQLYIAKCVLSIWIFVDMFKSSNHDTTPSGASRRDDLLNLILEIHFCWFLGFTKVALATLPKWAQNWWKALIICAISPWRVSCQMEFIGLPKQASNTFCHFTKIPFLTSSTNLHGLNFLPQLLLTLFYLQ